MGKGEDRKAAEYASLHSPLHSFVSRRRAWRGSSLGSALFKASAAEAGRSPLRHNQRTRTISLPASSPLPRYTCVVQARMQRQGGTTGTHESVQCSCAQPAVTTTAGV